MRKDVNSAIPGPTYICGYCGRARQCSTCGCRDCQAAQVAYAAQLGAMLVNRETVGHRPGRRMSAGERR